MKLIKVEINKYKSFSKTQSVDLGEEITVLVGKNESGKTAFLEALAKTNYFEEDDNFKFDVTNDYPRNGLSQYKKTGKVEPVITCTYVLTPSDKKKLEDNLGSGVFKHDTFSITTKYDNGTLWTIGNANEEQYLKNLPDSYELSSELSKQIASCKTVKAAFEFCSSYSGEEDISDVKSDLDNILKNCYDWDEKLKGYIAKSILKPLIPKFWYFDEYYELLGEIDLKELQENRLSDEYAKTAKALFDLAGINIKELISSEKFEEFKAQLESTSNEITDQIFEYWKTNSNLDIQFDIQKERVTQNHNYPFEKIVLHVRIYNRKHRLSLPLSNRSKGFNWFFSFIVWFSKIQSSQDKNFILLLDEPGLNLHASAQEDLLRFIEDLSQNYQIIYTTHSPFMIQSDHLERVRTVYDGEGGSVISEAIQEKDPNTLFPLQAALGYDIGQNLFVSKNNLLVEGVSDLTFLTILSSVLEQAGRESLNPKITIVPCGGLEKVPMFISLLRGSKLNIACLLDSYSIPISENQ
ncbi:MAG: AAA family ATPase [Saprospiraceae bacterium]